MSLLIKNGLVIDPSTGRDSVSDILIEKGLIKKVSEKIAEKGIKTTIDAGGCVVSPGFVDMHVHLREPGQENKETIETGMLAAAKGGFTSIACMPNTVPVNDNRSVTEYIIARSHEVGTVNVFPVAAISVGLDGVDITEMADLKEGGAKGFSDDGKCVMSADLIRKALEYTKMLNVPIIEHPEDHSISGEGQVNEGFISYKYGLRGMLSAAEEVIVARDIILQERINSLLHLTHISTAGSIDLIRNAKKKGIRVTSDVTPHHLLLTEELITSYNPVYKMKPPLRTEQDRKALIKALNDGTVDAIASDHAPHTFDEKDSEFEYAPFGVIGLETSFNVIYDRLVRKGILSVSKMIELFSTNPARIMGLDRRGVIEPGAHGDLTIFDPEKTFKIDNEKFVSKANNCPFHGWEGKGSVVYTITGGEIAYQA
ncbi:MAG: dihydroorotase [Candidatus Aminicenantes bacterium]|nr:dihydroorotase [Candidatus Aminicenantes bacterium]